MAHGFRSEEPARTRSADSDLLAIERSIRRLLFHGRSLVPALLTAILVLLALRPMLFEPELRLEGLLASMAGVGLSFAGVSFSAATALRERPRWSAGMTDAALMLLRFSLAIVVALALSTARVRLTNDFGSGTALDWVLRATTTVITAFAIVLAFFGFRALAVLLGPGLEVEEATTDAAPLDERPGDDRRASGAP